MDKAMWARVGLLISVWLCAPARSYDTARLTKGNLTGISLSAGMSHACAISQEGVLCWGLNDRGQTTVPKLNHPTQVTAGGHHTCALDSDGVKCWGADNQDQSTVPNLNHPVEVSAGDEHTCAIDADGVKCWGEKRASVQVVWPAHPFHISAGSNYGCALGKGGVECQGVDRSGQTAVPPLNRPLQISSGWGHACALDGDGVKCWGNYLGHPDQVPALDHPTQVSSGNLFSCALVRGGVKCWGLGPDVPRLQSPVQVSAGGSFACAVDEEGVKCWGKLSENVPEILQKKIDFSLAHLEMGLVHLSHFVYSDKRSFLEGLASDLGHSPILKDEPLAAQYRKYLARYFALTLLGPVLEDSDSQRVRAYLPPYRQSLERESRVMGISSLASIEPSPPVLSMALTLSRLALCASRPFILDPGMRAELERLLADLGALEAEVRCRGLAWKSGARLESLLDKSSRLFEVLLQHPRTRGFGVMLEKLREYLRGSHV